MKKFLFVALAVVAPSISFASLNNSKRNILQDTSFNRFYNQQRYIETRGKSLELTGIQKPYYTRGELRQLWYFKSGDQMGVTVFNYDRGRLHSAVEYTEGKVKNSFSW